jgi:HlyD family secretion protein
VRLVRLGAQTVQNVVTYTAVIGVENGDLALMPGMTANLQIVTDERSDSLRVPNAALRFRPAGQSAAAPPMPDSTAPQPPSSVQRGARAIESLRERVATEVRPTPEQTAEIDRIIAESRQSFPGREPGIADEDRRAAMRQFRREMQAKIAAALDPERRAKFEAIVAEGRRGPGAPGAQVDPAVPGRVFVPDADGKPRAVALRLGVTDGSFTEVLGGDLKEGAAVIVGGGPRPPAPTANAESAPGSRPSRGPRLF